VGKYEVIVFFDRDGVLTPSLEVNGVPKPMYRLGHSLDEGMKAMFDQMRSEKSCFFAMVTNQPDISRGYRNLDDVIEENEKVAGFFDLNDWEMCIHDSSDECQCRKPRDGMVHRIVERNEIDLSRANVYVVGDRASDMGLAEAIGAQGLFVNYDYTENRLYKFNGPTFPNTYEVMEHLLEESKK